MSTRRGASCWLVFLRSVGALWRWCVMKALLSGESAAGLVANRKFGIIALSVALAALMWSQIAFAARRHHVAATPAEEESAASASNTGLGPYSAACVLEPV